MAFRKQGKHYLIHSEAIAAIGDWQTCPFKGSNATKPPPKADLMAWLKLQRYKLQYRQLYNDGVVCLTYILFVCNVLRWHHLLPYSCMMFMLFAGCLLFISVHLPRKPKPAEKRIKSDWQSDWPRYARTQRKWPMVFKAYLLTLLVLIILFIYTGNNELSYQSGLLTFCTAMHFFMGLVILLRTLVQKEITDNYIRQVRGRL